MTAVFIVQSLALSSGLAMDASAVAMIDGLKEPSIKRKKAITIALCFGIFQAIMPLIGYFLGSIFVDYIAEYLPWVSLLLLGYLGALMIWNGIKKKEDTCDDNQLTLKVLISQAFATAIDALSIGLIMVEYSPAELAVALSCIGIVTFTLSFISIYIGIKFGKILANKAEIIGGIILIIIGLQIFIMSFI